MISLKLDTSNLRASLRKRVKSATFEVYSSGWYGNLKEMIRRERELNRDPWFLPSDVLRAVADDVRAKIMAAHFIGGRQSARLVLDEIGKRILSAVKDNLSTARNDGGSFAPLSDERKEQKERQGLDRRPMFATGRLYDSLRHRVK